MGEIAGHDNASYDIGVIAHEITHQYLVEGLGVDVGSSHSQEAAVHEGVANFAAASFLRTPVIGRMTGVGITGAHSHYDLERGLNMGGAELLQSRATWYHAAGGEIGVSDAMFAVEPHRGSGVVSTPLTEIARDIGWEQAQRITFDALGDPRRGGGANFGQLADALRLTARMQFDIDSPEYRAVVDALHRASLTGRPRPGDLTSYIRPDGSIAHMETVIYNLTEGRVVVEDGHGRQVEVSRQDLFNDVSLVRRMTDPAMLDETSRSFVDPSWPPPTTPPVELPGQSGVRIDHVNPPGNATPAHPRASAIRERVVEKVATPEARLDLTRRIANHLFLSEQAMISTNAAIQTEALLDRIELEREQTEALLLAELDRIARLESGR